MWPNPANSLLFFGLVGRGGDGGGAQRKHGADGEWRRGALARHERLIILKMALVTEALWARSTKNPDERTGPLAHPFASSLAPLTCSLAPHYSLCLRTLLRSLARSLTHFAHSQAHGTVNDRMAIYSVFFSGLDHSAPVSKPTAGQ